MRPSAYHLLLSEYDLERQGRMLSPPYREVAIQCLMLYGRGARAKSKNEQQRVGQGMSRNARTPVDHDLTPAAPWARSGLACSLLVQPPPSKRPLSSTRRTWTSLRAWPRLGHLLRRLLGRPPISHSSSSYYHSRRVQSVLLCCVKSWQSTSKRQSLAMPIRRVAALW